MKRIACLLSLLLLTSCVDTNDNTFILSGTIANAQEQEQIYLSYPISKNGVWYERTDTAKIIGGKFRFEGETMQTTPAFLGFDNMDGEFLYLEPTTIRLRMDRTCPYAYTLSGVSVENELSALHNALAKSQKTRYESHRHAQNLNVQWLAAEERHKDSLWLVFYDAVKACKRDLFIEDSLRLAFATKHPDYAITPHLFYLSSRRQVCDNQLLQQTYDRLPESSKSSTLGQLAGIQIGFLSGDAGFEIGDMAPDFIRTDATGKNIRLSNYRTKNYVLLDFWASWCGPCHKEIPKVKELYAKYGSRGLQIIGISSDDDKNKWLSAIEANALTAYPQLLSIEPSDKRDVAFFKDQADISSIYNVKSIPLFVLIDKDGRITGRWQHIDEELLSYLDQALR